MSATSHRQRRAANLTPRQRRSRRRVNGIALAVIAVCVIVIIAIALSGGSKSAGGPKLTSFQQCVQAYEQHPNETAQQIVPSTQGCRVIPLGEAKVTALMDAANHDNPATVKP